MATIKYEVLKHNMRKDKTWNVVIRVTHKRVMKYIPTTVFVTRDELTSSFKIKNFQKKEKCEDILRIYRKRIEEENLEFNDMTADELGKENHTQRHRQAYFCRLRGLLPEVDKDS
jgi:hypothetical protein